MGKPLFYWEKEKLNKRTKQEHRLNTEALTRGEALLGTQQQTNDRRKKENETKKADEVTVWRHKLA